MSEPTMLCVQLMGTLKKVVMIMKQKPLNMHANIINCVFSSSKFYSSGIISEHKFAESFLERKKAPQNSAMAPNTIKLCRLAAFDP